MNFRLHVASAATADVPQHNGFGMCFSNVEKVAISTLSRSQTGLAPES